METCLVTKLNAVVSNPDLPVLETMQQFTLNAITASGNNSMTDTQKWALNHFFYQIGAISNSGIFSKLETVFMPFLATDIAKSLVNYKNNVAFSTTNLEFLNKGIVANSSVNRVDVSAVSTSSLVGLTYLFGTKSKQNQALRLVSNSDSTFTVDAIGTIAITPTQTYSTSLNISIAETTKLLGVSITGLSLNDIFAYTSDGSNVTKPTIDVKSDFRDVTATTSQMRVYKVAPVVCAVFGSLLTDTELKTLTEAMQELMDSFGVFA